MLENCTKLESFALLMGFHHGACILGNLFFSLVYRFDWFNQRKFQPGKWPPTALVWRAWRNFFIDLFVTLPLSAWFLLVPILQTTAASSLPSWPIILAQLASILLMTDFIFYFFHRLLHHPALYSRIHKQHHEFKAVTVIGFEYSHPIETLTNAISVILPPLILGAHPLVASISLGLRMWESVDAHCGYDMPWYVSPWVLLRSARRHDYHHSKNVGSYGIFPIWDKLLGTAESYERAVAKEKSIE